MNNLLVRTFTGVAFVALIVGGTLASPLSFVVLFAAITGLATWEFSANVNAHAGASVNSFINSLASVYLFFAFAGYCGELVPPGAFIPYLLTMVYLMVSELYLRKSDPLKNWSLALASQMYIGLAFSMLPVLAFQYDPMAASVRYEPWLPLSVFLFLWASDTGAYVCGSLLHRRFPAKLFERISPHKSWVGSIGGGLLCLGTAAVTGHFLDDIMPLPHWLGMGAVVCVFGTWGDLFESLFKRQLGIKDSGRLLPGHGGMLDRFDSALLALPATVVYLYTIRVF